MTESCGWSHGDPDDPCPECSEIDTAAIRAEHTRGEVVIGEGYCRRDKLPWPCDAIRLADALDRQGEETARLREQNLATDHDAFAALEAETARLRAEVLERDVLVGMMRDDNNSIHDTAKFHAEQAEQLRRELRAAESREAQEKAQADTRAEIRELRESHHPTHRDYMSVVQQRDDALARLDEIRALCDERDGCVTEHTRFLIREIRLVLDRNG